MARGHDVKTLGADAGTLWDEQRKVLRHANALLAQAGDQFAGYAQAELIPSVKKNVRNAVAANVTPAIDSNLKAARTAAGVARDRVAPAVGAAVATAKGVDVAGSVKKAASKVTDRRNELVKSASKAAGKAKKSGVAKATKLGVKAGVVKQKHHGPGRYILISLVVVAVAGIAYAAWQTFRADDDLWIEDEPDSLTETEAQSA